MAIFIQLLLMALPKALEWLLTLLKKNQRIPVRQMEEMNKITWYADQIRLVAPKAGCAMGGVAPKDG